jgi:hypothetical protein
MAKRSPRFLGACPALHRYLSLVLPDPLPSTLVVKLKIQVTIAANKSEFPSRSSVLMFKRFIDIKIGFLLGINVLAMFLDSIHGNVELIGNCLITIA